MFLIKCFLTTYCSHPTGVVTVISAAEKYCAAADGVGPETPPRVVRQRRVQEQTSNDAPQELQDNIDYKHTVQNCFGNNMRTAVCGSVEVCGSVRQCGTVL
jgi:hypothetical protein